MDADTELDGRPVTALDLLASLQHRANSLLTELREYQSHLLSKADKRDVEMRVFRRNIEAEAKGLNMIDPQSNKSCTDQDLADEEEAKHLQTLRSSNLPFYEAVWSAAKQCRGIRALGKRIHWDAAHYNRQNGTKTVKSRRHVLVDIIAQDGLEWSKVSIVTDRRLLFEMAKEGWEGYGDASDDSDHQIEEDGSRLNTRVSKLQLVRLAEELREASKSVRIKYQHPRVRFVFPKISEGVQPSIDALLADIRATGAEVDCASEKSPAGDDSTKHECYNHNTNCLSKMFNQMLPGSPYPDLTATLNIDCTILLALISDISHMTRSQLPPSPSNTSGTYHQAITKQIEAEEHSPLLPDELYPALMGRKLVCTDLAAQRMREIVATMGTPSEKKRAELLLGEEGSQYPGQSKEDPLSALRNESCWPVPDDLHLPIEVITFPAPTTPTSTHPPQLDAHHTTASNHIESPPDPLANRLLRTTHLSPINKSVFLYGWTQDIVTVTSNRVVATALEKGINALLDEDEEAGRESGRGEGGGVSNGPKMWVCETARSLIGKEKQGGGRLSGRNRP